MPAKAENISAFDLKLLKALLNFKLNRSHLAEVTTEQKRMLCKSYNEGGGIIEIRADYLLKIWPKEKEISQNISYDTLDQLCSIFKKDYRWHFFVYDISALRPEDIPYDKPYLELKEAQKKLIDEKMKAVFRKYATFEEFKKEVIDKIASPGSEQKNEIITHPVELREEKISREIKRFANRIYIELTTRKAAIPIDEDKDVIEEIYNSWYKLFCIIRDEMKALPVNYLKDQASASPIMALAMKTLNEALRPHLTEHQAKYRAWLVEAKQNAKYKNLSPQELQRRYPEYENLIQSMQRVNEMLIAGVEKFYLLLS